MSEFSREVVENESIKPLGHYVDMSNADAEAGRFYCATCAEMVGDYADISIHKVKVNNHTPHGHEIIDLEREK